LYSLTASGNIRCRHCPNSLPQAAPTRRLGMNKPLGIASPYVQHDSINMHTQNNTRVTGLKDPIK